MKPSKFGRKPRPQSGNALFIILIAIALLAALTYSVTRSGRTGVNISPEKASIAASEMLSQANAVEAGVNMLMSQGIALGSLDFGAWGAPCTSGADCVYAPDGAGVPYGIVPLDARNAGNDAYYAASSGESITDIGTAANEVILVTWLNQSVCEAINRKLGLSVPPAQNSCVLCGVIDAYPGERTACYEQFDWAAGTYAFYHVLVEQ
jgi:hypothetical protein